MEPLSIASFGIGAGSSILGGVLGFDQADQMRKETAEQVRRFGLIKQRTESEATALGNASGITEDSGSLTKYLSDMNSEFTKQMNWMRDAGNAKADATEMSALFGLGGDLGGNIFKYGAANNWFRQPTVR